MKTLRDRLFWLLVAYAQWGAVPGPSEIIREVLR